jgi:hypothetical protein
MTPSKSSTLDAPTAPPTEVRDASTPARQFPLTALLVIGCAGVGVAAWFGAGSSAGGSSGAENQAAVTGPEGSQSVDGAALEPGNLGGRVAEVIQVSNYTYVRVESQGGTEFWAAVTSTQLSEGDVVKFEGADLMSNFESKELGRVFPQIYFGRLAGETTARADGKQSDLQGHGHFAPPTAEEGAAAKKAASLLAESVEVTPAKRAEGPLGRNIAEIYAQAEELSGKKVRVSGTVVKLTRNVMGTNFLHIRDGSGDAVKQTHDLVLKVENDPPNLGIEALFEGTVAEDIDLGAGYSYPVLLEDARVLLSAK